ncbi:MAG: hypothetical protein IJ751_06825 [Oscillospiraceae bacterium]|nr:hypothetical protein [Oscillospiraceae bacterium]
MANQSDNNLPSFGPKRYLRELVIFLLSALLARAVGGTLFPGSRGAFLALLVVIYIVIYLIWLIAARSWNKRRQAPETEDQTP